MNASSGDSFEIGKAKISRKVMRARSHLPRPAHITLSPRPRCSTRYLTMGGTVPRIVFRTTELPVVTAPPRPPRLRFSLLRLFSSSSSSSSSETSTISVGLVCLVVGTAAAADAPVVTDRGCCRDRFVCVGSETGSRAARPSDGATLTVLSLEDDTADETEEAIPVVTRTLSAPWLHRTASLRSCVLRIVT